MEVRGSEAGEARGQLDWGAVFLTSEAFVLRTALGKMVLPLVWAP